MDVEYVPGTEKKAYIFTKPLARIKFKEMRSLIGVQDFFVSPYKFGVNAGISMNVGVIGNSFLYKFP